MAAMSAVGQLKAELADRDDDMIRGRYRVGN